MFVDLIHKSYDHDGAELNSYEHDNGLSGSIKYGHTS
jgi:hypothetical protein